MNVHQDLHKQKYTKERKQIVKENNMSVIPCISYFSFSGFAVGVPLLSCTLLFTAGLSLWYRLLVLQHGVCVSAKCIPLFFLNELRIESLHFWERIRRVITLVALRKCTLSFKREIQILK